jgi:hypothetical protein
LRYGGVVRAPWILCAALFGCYGNVTTVYPSGLTPLETNEVPDPSAPGDPHPEILNLRSGSLPDYDLVHARGFVKAPISTVWAAFQDPTVVVDRRAISSFTATVGVESGYDTSFRTHYVINRIVTVEFELTWRESAVAGSRAEPVQVAVGYQKTWGSTLVNLMDGFILLSDEDDATEISFVQHMKATTTGPSDIASWTHDMFASIVARVHGKPLPTY